MRPKLQIALDFIDLDEAIRVASQVNEYVDFIEAGTPLIKAEGLRSVRRLKEEFGERVIVADLKTMDTGFLEASIAYEYGADYSTVMGVADIGTVKGAIKARDEYGKGIMVDLMNVDDPEVILLLDDLNPDYFVVHSGIDMQHRGISPFEKLGKLSKMKLSAKLGVAGGINLENIDGLKNTEVDLIIVGGFLTEAESPRTNAKELLERIESLF